MRPARRRSKPLIVTKTSAALGGRPDACLRATVRSARAGGSPAPKRMILAPSPGRARKKRRRWSAGVVCRIAMRAGQFSVQVAGLAEVNSALVAHSGWSMNGLRLPWKL